MSDTFDPASPKRRSWLVVLPALLFAGLAVLFWFRLGDSDVHVEEFQAGPLRRQLVALG